MASRYRLAKCDIPSRCAFQNTVCEKNKENDIRTSIFTKNQDWNKNVSDLHGKLPEKTMSRSVWRYRVGKSQYHDTFQEPNSQKNRSIRSVVFDIIVKIRISRTAIHQTRFSRFYCQDTWFLTFFLNDIN